MGIVQQQPLAAASVASRHCHPFLLLVLAQALWVPHAAHRGVVLGPALGRQAGTLYRSSEGALLLFVLVMVPIRLECTIQLLEVADEPTV